MVHWAKVVSILEMLNPINVHIWGASSDYVIITKFMSKTSVLLFILSMHCVKKDVAWTWSEKTQEAFDTLKEKHLEFLILRRLDFNKVVILHID
jgi:hypothetical protein